MGRRGSMIKSCGKFGAWMKEQIESSGLTAAKLADMLKITKSTICAHLNMRQKPSYMAVVAYCYYLNASPIDAWKLVEEDWGE